MRLPAIALLALMSLALGACQQKDTAEEDPADFYRGKTISMIVGVSVGGIYDNVGRIVARFLGKHIPGNPSIIVQNMPGAGSLTAANFLYNVAPKDGTTMGIMVDGALLAPLWKFPGANYDSREVGWLGSLHKRDTSTVMIRTDSPATTMQDATKTEIVLGSTGANSLTSALPKMLNELLDTKFKVVVGYPGYQEIMLAVERGEVHGRAATNWRSVNQERPQWVANNFVLPLVQLTLDPIPGMENVPMAINLAKNEDDRKVMRAVLGTQLYSYLFAVAPGTPPKRLAALRKAFEEMTKDPEFLKAMHEYSGEDVHPLTAQQIHDYVEESYAMPEEIRARASQYVGAN